MAVPPLGRASLNLASLPSSRNWAIQASISCALTSSGEILTFISKPSLRYTKLADGLRHASRRVKVLARPPAQPNALRAEAAAEEVGLLSSQRLILHGNRVALPVRGCARDEARPWCGEMERAATPVLVTRRASTES
jgi:hypothetical protein